MRYASLLILILLQLATVAHAQPTVVVSIKPIQGLAASIMEGVSTPKRLLPDWSSPHSYTLRPSDARALEQADLVIWVGPELENFLARPIGDYRSGESVLTLTEIPDLLRLPVRESGLTDGGHDHSHDHAIDGHIWLDPRNAQAIVRAIAASLSRIDPENEATYLNNRDVTLARLDDLDHELTVSFTDLTDKPYTVLHDAFHYLEHRYGLRQMGSLSLSSAIPPSAKRLRELRERIRTLGVTCVFAEPQASEALLNTLIEGSSARAVRLDPLGFETPEGPGTYGELMRRLADRMVECLGATAPSAP